MKTAQDYLQPSASGECRGGFNSRLHGESLLECLRGVLPGFRWGQRLNGWEIADRMIKEGKIFSQATIDGTKIIYKCYMDGASWCCVGEGFVDLQESDNFAFGDTRDEALNKLGRLCLK